MYNISFHLKLYTIIYWTKKYSPKLRFHNKVIYKCKSDGCELVNQHCIWSKREGFVGLVKLNMTNRRAWHFIVFYQQKKNQQHRRESRHHHKTFWACLGPDHLLSLLISKPHLLKKNLPKFWWIQKHMV